MMIENNKEIKIKKKKIDPERWMHNLSNSKDKGKFKFMFIFLTLLGLYVYHLMGAV
ncbi:hypothetical protein [Pantoea agglomerans]|uniref:hypothetical protein n=1 Tax=Enterobacter agglomerans TaxID=549 RepID=UPI0034CF8AED